MNKVSRLLKMLILLHQNEMIQISVFEDIFQISNKQVRRYKDELKMSGFDVCSQTGQDGGIYLSNRNELLNDLDINGKLIYLVSNIEGMTINRAFSIVLKYLSEAFMKHIPLNNLTPQEFHLLSIVTDSIDSNRVLSIKYGTEFESVEMIVNSYFIYRKYRTWYLICEDSESKNIVNLNLDYVFDPNLSNEQYSIKSAVLEMYQNRLRQMIGIYLPVKSYQVVIQTRVLKEVDLENVFECEIEKNGNQYQFISFDLGDTKSKILSLGSSVVVKEPIVLIDMIQTELKELLEFYS